MKAMLHRGDGAGSDEDAHIPWWRRLTALLTLSSLVVVAGTVMAVGFAATVLFLLFVLERAIAG